MDSIVDLRSDTVTRPSAAMREAMATAVVGDDGFGEDPTVRALEARYAALVGKEAAIFVPSGVMANQIAIRVQTRPGDVVLAGRRAHVVLYEMGAAGRNASVQFATLDDSDGMLDAAEITAQRAGETHHHAAASLLCMENSSMAAGGAIWTRDRLMAVADAATGLKIHLDGARLFNASVASGISPAELAAPADSVMSCLSKGLGAPVGSMLAGSAAFIAEAGVERKRLGGAMRKAGILAAAGLIGLEQGIDRLAEDHRRATYLAEAIEAAWPTAGVSADATATNLVVAHLDNTDAVLAHLAAHGVLADTIAPRQLRFVTHLDVDDAGIERAVAAIETAPVRR